MTCITIAWCHNKDDAIRMVLVYNTLYNINCFYFLTLVLLLKVNNATES